MSIGAARVFALSFSLSRVLDSFAYLQGKAWDDSHHHSPHKLPGIPGPPADQSDRHPPRLSLRAQRRGQVIALRCHDLGALGQSPRQARRRTHSSGSARYERSNRLRPRRAVLSRHPQTAISGKSSKGTLDLQARGADGEWHIINEPTTRATQAKLDEILRLDYDTFINSAYLQQGRADLFATNQPSKRKEILVDILQLDQWALFDADAKAEVDRLSQQMHVIDYDIQRLTDETADEELIRSELTTFTKSHGVAQAALTEAEKEYGEVANSQQRLRDARQDHQAQQNNLASRRAAIERTKADIDKREMEIVEHQTVINDAEHIDAGYASLQAARKEQAAISDKIQKVQEIDEAAYQQRRALDSERVAMAKAANRQHEHIRQLAGRIADLQQYDIDSINDQLAALETHRADADGLREKLSQTENDISAIHARLEMTCTEGETLKKRLAQLQSADGGDCPLCNQPLTEQGKRDLIAQLEAETEAKREHYAKQRSTLTTKQADADTFRSELNKLSRELMAGEQLQQKKGMIEAKQADADKAAAELPDQKAKYEAIQAQLAAEDYAHDIRQRIAELDAQREAVGYDPDARDAVREKLARYDQYDALHTRLQQARSALAQSQEYVAGAKERLADLEQELTEAEEQLQALQTRIEGLEKLAALETEKRLKVDALRREVQDLNQQITIKQQELGVIEDSQRRIAQLEGRLVDIKHEHGLYLELREAFGKRGVPALIIETAIPEIEAEANELLGRMTDGLMAIRLQTQREKITGGTSETLDIEIEDPLGARSYDMYSGGEAFRINLALRIALSKVLAKRAGAQLRALFIDEGFGSQDGSGRSKLVEAINRIQDDFDMILVITHIEELRDSFPVQLMVEKTNSGSQVTLRSA